MKHQSTPKSILKKKSKSKQKEMKKGDMLPEYSFDYNEAKPNRFLNPSKEEHSEFVKSMYGILADDPITRPPQLNFEEREEIDYGNNIAEASTVVVHKQFLSPSAENLKEENTMVTLDQTLDVAMQLSTTEREMLIDILRKRQIEMRRTEIAMAAREAIAEYHAGKIKPESADEVIKKLHLSLDEKDDE